MRVERGPHWRWGDQDGGVGSIGVIIAEIQNGWCTVRWASGYENGYRAGEAGHYDLRIARASARSRAQSYPHETRESHAAPLTYHGARLQPGKILDSHHVRPGLQVQRGPDWRWGDQDGGIGSIGTVQAEERLGWARVRWPSGAENGYRVGDSGKYDLQV